MTFQHSHIRPAREIRRLVQTIADAAEAERQQYRGRKRRRGDCGRSFWDDPDRFALAFMVSIQLAGEHTALRFGTRRSAWATALHAAALITPGGGQRVTYSHRVVDGVLLAKAAFKAGPDRHANPDPPPYRECYGPYGRDREEASAASQVSDRALPRGFFRLGRAVPAEN